jgi:hypothetical protein
MEASAAAAHLREAASLESAYQDMLSLLAASSSSIVIAALPRPLVSYLGQSNADAAADLVGYADALLRNEEVHIGAMVARLMAAQLVNALGACADTADLTATTTRFVVGSEQQAAYLAQWRAACGGRDFCFGAGAHPYDGTAMEGVAALTTPAGSRLVHRDDLPLWWRQQ